jgi:heme/copper-type cytochrome/quinol oxidase subunit 2
METTMALSWFVLLALALVVVFGLLVLAAIVALIATTRRRNKGNDGTHREESSV